MSEAYKGTKLVKTDGIDYTEKWYWTASLDQNPNTHPNEILKIKSNFTDINKIETPIRKVVMKIAWD